MTDNLEVSVESKREFLLNKGILVLNIKDEDTLFSCYMPFVKGCGLFYPGKIKRELGDEVFLLFNILEDVRLASAAKVIWVNSAKNIGKSRAGVGLQLIGRDVDSYRAKIEDILGKKVYSPKLTMTM